MRQRTWSVGELARAAGITVRTLHHYDRLGLLTSDGRTSGGHRRYVESDVARLYRVLALRELGLELAQIATLLDSEDPDGLLSTVRAQRERVERQLAEAGQLRGRLDDVIRRLEADPGTLTDTLLATMETMAMAVHLTRIYTRLGDDGFTHLADQSRVAKDDPRVEAMGDVDELIAAVGVARTTPGDLPEEYRDWLRQVQNDLFDLGADLSHPTPASAAVVGDAYVTWLEQCCDRANAQLAPLRSFVLPGGTSLVAALHLARAICRRAERRVVALAGDSSPRHYLNRLSDLLFILSRAASQAESEDLWEPGHHPVPR